MPCRGRWQLIQQKQLEWKSLSMALTAGCVRDRASPHFPQTSKMGRGGVREKETKREWGLKSGKIHKQDYSRMHQSFFIISACVNYSIIHKLWVKLYVRNAYFHRWESYTCSFMLHKVIFWANSRLWGKQNHSSRQRHSVEIKAH